MINRALNDLDEEIKQMEENLTGTPKEPTNKDSETKEPVKPQEPAESAIVQQLKRDLSTAQKRYNNYKASTDITIRDSRNELESLRSQVSNLQAEISKLKASTTPKKDLSSYFTPEDREILGESTVEALDKSVNDIVNAKVTPLQEQLDRERAEKARLQKEQRAKSIEDARTLFITRLKSVVPDYQQILDKSEFYTWIEEVDTVSGYPRKELFTRAEKQGDVGRVASFFNEYRAFTASKKSALEEHIVPTGVGGDVGQVKKEQEFQIDERFINKFYDDLAKGHIKYKGKKGRELEQRTEAAIDKWVANLSR